MDFACFSQAQADQFKKDFNINIQSFGGNELCNNDIDTKKLFNDLSIIENGRFQADNSNILIRGFIRADQYYTWMKSATYGVERGQDVPYATAYNSGGYFTMQDGWASLSTLGRVGTIIHEARHTDGYYHIACQQGPYMGSNLAGCDRNYSYGGSHAIEMEYYARVAVTGVNFHPVYKKMARLMAVGRANFVFNQIPIQNREALLALGQSGRSYLLQNNQWIEREAPLEKGLLKRMSAGAVLMTDHKPYVFDPYANSGYPWLVVDDYSYYKLLNSDRLSEKTVADFEEFDINRKRYVFIKTTQNEFTNFNFPRGSWNSFIRTPGQGDGHFTTLMPSGQYGFFYVDQNFDIYQIDPDRPQSFRQMNQKWPQDILMYAKTPTALYKLNQQNEIIEINGSNETLRQSPERILQMVSIPLYDSFEIQP